MSSPVTLTHLLVQQLLSSFSLHQRDKLYSLPVNNYVSGSIDGKKLASFMPDWHIGANIFNNTRNINAMFFEHGFLVFYFFPIRHVCSAYVQRYCCIVFRFQKEVSFVNAAEHIIFQTFYSIKALNQCATDMMLLA